MDGSGAGDGNLIARHKAVKGRLRSLRIIYVVVVGVLVVGYIWSIVNQVRNVDVEAIASRLEEGAHRLLPRVEQHLIDVANHIEPVLRKELESQGKKLEKRLEKVVEKESEQLKQRLTSQFEARVDKVLNEIKEDQKRVLVKHIPELAGNTKAQEQVADAVRAGLLKWSMKQLTHTFHEHLLAMEQIRKTLTESYAQRGPDAKQVQPDDAVMIWLELMNETIGGDDTILGGPKDEGKKKPRGKRGKK